jgi:hypothetical protein
MEERELTRLLEQLGDRVTPGPAPVRRIVDAGEALRGRRSGRMRVFAVAAAAAAVIGGGAVAATVIELPSSGGDASSAAGEAADAGSHDTGGDVGSAPQAESSDDAGEGAAAADRAGAVLAVTPEEARPGDTVVVTSREDPGFGLAWRLERQSASEWERQYTLAAAFSGDEPQWWPEGESWAVPAAMVSPPLEFVLPPDVAPGDYRICENGAPDDEDCAYLTVAD